MNNLVTTKKPEDPQEQGVFFTETGVSIHRYGEINDGRKWIPIQKLQELLKPRTDEDRVNFLEDSHRLVNVTFVGTRWYVLVDGENMFAAHTNFRSWREAMDAWMDQEEEV